MEIKGTLVTFEVDVQVAKNGGGSYKGCRLAYRDEQGALKEKGFSEQAFKFIPQVKTALSNLKPGDVFIAEVVKEGEYWNWKNVQAAGSAPVVSDKDTPATGKTTPYASPKSTYETPEERAKKQVYIIRQSSITAALSYTNQIKDFYKGTDNPIEEVINIAKQFEAYVLGDKFDDGTIKGMIDDVV